MPNSVIRTSAIAFCISLFTSELNAQSSTWHQFLGPERNGIIEDSVALVDSFPASGPKEKWRVPGGEGLSGFAFTSKLAISLANIAGAQQVVALNIESGESEWATALGRPYENRMGGSGPRATPTIDGKLVFAYLGDGILAALDVSNGQTKWQLNLPELLKTKPAEYGMASSPLVFGDFVIVHVGGAQGAVVAIDKVTGKGAWKAAAGPAGYSSPMLLDAGGEKQVVAFLGDKVVGIAPESGTELWTYPFVTDYACNTANPIAIEGDVLISAGENHGSVRLKLTKSNGAYTPVEDWASLGPKSSLRSEWQTPLLIDGYLYGFDNVGSAGAISHLVCVNADSGEQVWRKNRFGKGNMIYADGKVLMTTFEGEFAIGKISPKGYEETSRAKVVGENRQAPALSQGLVFLRDKSDFVCIDLRK